MPDQDDEQPEETDLSVSGAAHSVSSASASIVLFAASSLTVGADVPATAEVIPAPDLTSYGFPVTRTLMIKEGVNEGIIQYELIMDGREVWHGLGTDPVQGLVKAIVHVLAGDHPDFPKGE